MKIYFGENLKRLRQGLGFTQEQLAQRLKRLSERLSNPNAVFWLIDFAEPGRYHRNHARALAGCVGCLSKHS